MVVFACRVHLKYFLSTYLFFSKQSARFSACSNCEDFTKGVQTSTLPDNMLVPSDCGNGALLSDTGCKVTCKPSYQITPTLPKPVYVKCEDGSFVFTSDGKERAKSEIGWFVFFKKKLKIVLFS